MCVNGILHGVNLRALRVAIIKVVDLSMWYGMKDR